MQNSSEGWDLLFISQSMSQLQGIRQALISWLDDQQEKKNWQLSIFF